MKRTKIFIFIIIAVVITTSCTTAGNSDTPVVTRNWDELPDGCVEFETNDNTRTGTSEFCYYLKSESLQNTYTAEFERLSGYKYAGYGLVFGAQDPGNLYNILINENAKYMIRKKVNGLYSNLKDWTSSSDISDGKNTVSISTDASGNFILKINNVTQTTGVQDTTFTSGYMGFVTCTGESDKESFPEIPVLTRYKVIEPDVSGVELSK